MENTIQKNHVRDFFLYLLAIVTLYMCVWSFISLLFDYINVLLPDQLNTYYSWSYEQVRWSISMLIIVFPVYLGVTWFLRKDIIAYPEKRDLWVRKCLLYFTLFLAAITIIVDLVTLINNFLNGELTLRFFLKVLVVLVVAAAVFGYYLWDLHRETKQGDKPSKVLVWTAALAVFISIVSGFFIIGSPATQRQRRFDEQRINDLQRIQGEVINYWSQKQKLPAQLGDLNNDITGFRAPVDPSSSASYEYQPKGRLAFELCANFNLGSSDKPGKTGYSAPVPYYPGDVYSQNWTHESGRVCYERTIDPELYRKVSPKY
ncbi:MAG: DUF5671 domain-containing protein [Patescibacteria group bacterium]